jgi:urease accessory protein
VLRAAGQLPGTGLLEFSLSGSRTVVTRSFATSPLKLLNPRNHGRAAWVFSSSYGGGLLGGDRIALTADVRAGAAALLSTQASTKVYRSERPARQELCATVATDGMLVLAPDPVACFADSRYSQQQTVHLAGNAGLVLVDWVTCGRRASGERWDLRGYDSRTEIFHDGRKILHDVLRLSPQSSPISDQMGRFNTLATAVLCGPGPLDAGRKLVSALHSRNTGRQVDLLQSAAVFQDAGVLLRIAGVSIEETGRALRQHLAFVGASLGEDPWARKW